jgi:hypothetical protein
MLLRRGRLNVAFACAFGLAADGIASPRFRGRTASSASALERQVGS